MHVQFKSSRDYAESLKLITFVVFLFEVIGICKSAISGNCIKLSLEFLTTSFSGLTQGDLQGHAQVGLPPSHSRINANVVETVQRWPLS